MIIGEPNDETVLTVLHKMAPLLEPNHELSDHDWLELWGNMPDDERQMIFDSYGRISWEAWHAAQ